MGLSGSGKARTTPSRAALYRPGIGTPLYDERASVSRLAAVKTRWTTMNAELTTALEKGAKPRKVGHRHQQTSSRSTCASSQGAERRHHREQAQQHGPADCDLRLQFGPVQACAAAEGEAIFAVVNDLYVNGLKGPFRWRSRSSRPRALRRVVADAEAAAST